MGTQINKATYIMGKLKRAHGFIPRVIVFIQPTFYAPIVNRTNFRKILKKCIRFTHVLPK